MQDVSANENNDIDRGILLVQVGTTYMLLDGEAHMDALLAAEKTYPTPVHCVRFSSMFDLSAQLPEGTGTGALWSVHPEIIKRLERDNEIVTVEFSEEV